MRRYTSGAVFPHTTSPRPKEAPRKSAVNTLFTKLLGEVNLVEDWLFLISVVQHSESPGSVSLEPP